MSTRLSTTRRAHVHSRWPATIQRVETDSDGVYEAHLDSASPVEVGEDFAVTGLERGGQPAGM